jgi:dinuclear metal center YbgI/SA1388 family protein
MEAWMNLNELSSYLDDYLCHNSVPDYRDAFNGLQVEGRPEIKRIAVSVDACSATIAQAISGGADMMIVHHGLFWGAKAPVTGAYYRRLSALIKNDLSLYSTHMPLDAHPEVGNNYVLARLLGLTIGGMFGEYEGVAIGVWAETEMGRGELIDRIKAQLGIEPLVIATGPAAVRKVGIITGGAGSMIRDAQQAGCDTFITGEGAHHTYFEAEERGLNVIYAGHYATETVGVKALAQHLERRFGLETFFIDHPTGL